jgi:hypothetical protein
MKYIAGIFYISAMFCFGAAAFSMPIGIGAWLYEWAVNDIELKLALWNAFVIWLKLVFGGLILGYILMLIANFLDK